MKFLVDAQLPSRLARFLADAGHNSIHTSELPAANESTDSQIIGVADAEERVVVTKDRDFRNSHLLHGKPRRLLIVTTGNITNDDLLALFDTHLPAISAALEEASFVELGTDRLIVHRT